jgi:hypothetical protein
MSPTVGSRYGECWMSINGEGAVCAGQSRLICSVRGRRLAAGLGRHRDQGEFRCVRFSSQEQHLSQASGCL